MSEQVEKYYDDCGIPPSRRRSRSCIRVFPEKFRGWDRAHSEPMIAHTGETRDNTFARQREFVYEGGQMLFASNFRARDIKKNHSRNQPTDGSDRARSSTIAWRCRMAGRENCRRRDDDDDSRGRGKYESMDAEAPRVLRNFQMPHRTVGERPGLEAFTDGKRIGASFDRNGLRPRVLSHER